MEGDHTAELFAGVDALLAQAAAVLPDAGERRRLREAAHLSPVQIADALKTSPELVEGWESGLVEPSGPQRVAYARLLKGLLDQERTQDNAAPLPSTPASRPREQAPPPQKIVPVPRSRATTATSRGPHRSNSSIPGEHFPAGPLAVLDGDGTLTAHLADGATLTCPASTVVGVLHWALRSGIGQPRLATYGRAADPLIVLTPSAAHHLGLPPDLEDRAGLRLPARHPVIEAVTADGWKLTHRGFGPWARIHQAPADRQRRSVQLAVTGWGALSAGGWNPPADLTAQELARWLGIYAERVLTPCGSTAVCGQELMTALRPPTKPVQAPSGTWQRGNNHAALWNPVEPAPPEAPDTHPLARGRGRGPHDALDEEAWDWHRHPTADEAGFPHVVGLDINLAFVAAAGSLVTGLTAPPEHVTRPAFDKKIPGAWYCDLSRIVLDPRLPSPFTPTGLPPTGPAWYATPTLAYAVELGATVQPAEAYLRLEHSTYLTPWYKHLRDAYMATMNDLGITESMNQAGYLAAMRSLPGQDPFLLSLLAAIKATGKGGIGKLRAGPRDPRRAPFEPWPALNTPTWRPDIRAALISRARTNMHRKMLRTAQETGRYPLAVLSDCALYPADRPTALDAVPQSNDGNGVTGAFRLGVNPGLAKEEGVQSMAWLLTTQRDGTNPARYIKGTGTP